MPMKTEFVRTTVACCHKNYCNFPKNSGMIQKVEPLNSAPYTLWDLRNYDSPKVNRRFGSAQVSEVSLLGQIQWRTSGPLAQTLGTTLNPDPSADTQSRSALGLSQGLRSTFWILPGVWEDGEQPILASFHFKARTCNEPAGVHAKIHPGGS